MFSMCGKFEKGNETLPEWILSLTKVMVELDGWHNDLQLKRCS